MNACMLRLFPFIGDATIRVPAHSCRTMMAPLSGALLLDYMLSTNYEASLFDFVRVSAATVASFSTAPIRLCLEIGRVGELCAPHSRLADVATCPGPSGGRRPSGADQAPDQGRTVGARSAQWSYSPSIGGVGFGTQASASIGALRHLCQSPDGSS